MLRRSACAIAAGVLCAAAGGALAQTRPADAEALCRVPLGTVASEATLRHVAATLEHERQLRVLAIGSSSTYGLGASSPARAYPAVVEGLLEKRIGGHHVTVVNRGVNGEKAAETAIRMVREVADHAPQLVLWQVGTNDGLANVPVAEFKATLVRTIRWLRARDIDVALVGLQYTKALGGHEHYRAIKEAVREVAAEEKVLHIRRYDAMLYLAREHAQMDLLAQDQFHLNDLGYRCMAEHVATAVVGNLYKHRQMGTQVIGTIAPDGTLVARARR
jgi:lysophospholipase L1-like esterase